MTKEVLITIETRRKNLNYLAIDALNRIFESDNEVVSEDYILKAFSSKVKAEDIEKTEMMTRGVLSCDDEGQVELNYCDSESMEVDGSYCRIIFNKDDPKLVSMVREGPITALLCFEPNRRHKSTYNTPFMPFDICVRTISVDNRLLTEGELIIDYYIEIRGFNAEHTVVKTTLNKKPG